MNNTLEGFNSTITEAGEQTSNLEGSMVEITAAKQNTEKKNEKKIVLQDNIKGSNIHITKAPEGEERKVLRKYLKIAEDFPTMGKEIVNEVQEVQSPRQDKPTHTLRHPVIKLTKIKDEDKMLKATRETQ